MPVKILNENNQYELNVGGRNKFMCSCEEHMVTICGCNNSYCHICFPSDCECMHHCIDLRQFLFPPENIPMQEEESKYSKYSPYLITKCRICTTEHIIFAYFGAKYASDTRNR